VGIQPLIGKKGMLTYPKGMLAVNDGTPLDRMLNIHNMMHPFTHVHITPKGLDAICQYVDEVRSVVGYEIPIAADHFGHIGIDDCLKLGKALEPYNLAWLEDMVPWQFTDQWVQLERALDTPVCTGEDIYLLDAFKPLLDTQAVNVIHPDLASSGGILETKKIGDYAAEKGVSMAMHMAGTPISTMASVHCAAATENFIALEHHFSEIPFWSDFITIPGRSGELIKDGYIEVPEGPGLGFEINDDVVREHLIEGASLWAPTPEWDGERAWDRMWS
jgi:L-alanine-DL-glutamate epimerase-like enolase superfamily enzyme